MFTARRGALAILNALAMTAEAWLARAGYSIDLNNDGHIGHVRPVLIEPVQDRVTSPMVLNSPQGTRLLAQNAPAVIGDVDGIDQADPEPPRPAIQRHLWELPNGVKCPVGTVVEFVEGIFVRGWSRSAWVPKLLEREVYDGLIELIEQGRVLEGRKKGHAGRLTVQDASEAKRVLGLITRPSAFQPVTNGDLPSRYEHI